MVVLKLSTASQASNPEPLEGLEKGLLDELTIGVLLKSMQSLLYMPMAFVLPVCWHSLRLWCTGPLLAFSRGAISSGPPGPQAGPEMGALGSVSPFVYYPRDRTRKGGNKTFPLMVMYA